ncbi:MAG: hypothetical protein JNL42_04860 [Anaerolineae bacterium]|nr:hypothetical protein [Anaerolineae bacterium]
MPDSNANTELLRTLERSVSELIDVFAVNAPPVPVERMLQDPRPGMWREIDISQISTGFLKITSPYSPRMSLARFLARMIAQCEWGQVRGVPNMNDDVTLYQQFARMIVMPARMIEELRPDARTPQIMSVYFEVPEEDVRRRLEDLIRYSA